MPPLWPMPWQHPSVIRRPEVGAMESGPIGIELVAGLPWVAQR